MEKKIEEEKNFNKDLYKLYNMVIKIDSMDQLTKEGWQIIRKEAKKINDKNVKGKQVSIISVLGNKNTGKSFILHLLTGKKIPNGYTVTTEGLSLIIPEDGVIDVTGSIPTPLSQKLVQMDKDLKTREEISKAMNPMRNMKFGMLDGQTDVGYVSVGLGVSMIHSIRTCKEIIDDISQDFKP